MTALDRTEFMAIDTSSIRSVLPFRVLLLVLPVIALVLKPACGQEIVTASSGRDFYVALPWLDRPGPQGLRIDVTAIDGAEVTLAFTETGADTSASITPGGRWEVLVPYDQIALPLQETISDRTIHITSDAPVTVNATFDAPYLADAYTAFPTPSLGFDYVAMCHPSGDSATFQGYVVVIATEDGTSVDLTPTANTIGGNIAGFTYGVTLDQGQAYVVLPASARGTDLTGTRITANHPVAVISGHRSTQIGIGGANNSLIEEMVPTVDWGSRFYSTDLTGQDSAWYRVWAAGDATEVRANGRRVALLPAGGSTMFNSIGPTIIDATAPVMLAQYTTHFPADSGEPSGDPSMMLVNPLESYTEQFVWSTPTLAPRVYPGDTAGRTLVRFDHYAMLTAPVSAAGAVRLDGQAVTFDLTYGDGAFVSTIVRLAPGVHRLTAASPVNAQLFGYSDYDAYSMPAGVRLRDPFRAEALIARTCHDALDTTITLLNVGSEQIDVVSGTFSAGITGSLSAPGGFPYAIAPNSSRPLRVHLALPAYGRLVGTLTIRTSTSGARPLVVPIDVRRDSLAVDALAAAVTVDTLASGTSAGDTVIVVVNTGTGPTTISAASVSGPFAPVDPARSWRLMPGDTARIPVRFAPDGPGTFSGAVVVRHAECGAPVTVALSGTRLRAAAVTVAADAPPRVLCTDPGTSDFPIVVRNPGEEPLVVDSVENRSPVRSDYTLVSPPVGVAVGGGDSLLIAVRFTPQGTGVRQGVFRVWNAASPTGYELVTVQGRKDSVALSVDPPLVDFGTTTGCDTLVPMPVRLRGGGSVPVVVDSIDFARNDFELVDAFRGPVAPDSVVPLSVRFRASRTGRIADTMRVYSSPCGLVRTVVLQVTAGGAALATSVDTLDFGAVPSCLDAPTLAFEAINGGATTLLLEAPRIEGGGFALADARPDTLVSGIRRTIAVTFVGDENREYEAVVVLHAEPCGIERRVVLLATRVPVAVAPIADVQIPAAEVGDVVRDSTAVRNVGAIAIDVSAVDFDPPVPGLRLLAPELPVTIPPGDSVAFVFEFAPASSGSFATAATVHVDRPCQAEHRFSLTAGGELPFAPTVLLPDTSAAVDAHVSLPLTVEANRALEGRAELRAVVSWTRTTLVPLDARAAIDGAIATLERDGIDGETRSVAVVYNGPIPADGTILWLDVFVPLGDTDATGLRFDSLEVVPVSDRLGAVMAIDGSFHTDGVCRSGDGARLIRLDNRLRVERLAPNPCATTTQLRLHVPADGPVDIRLFDAAGNPIGRPRTIEATDRTPTVQLDLDGVPSGVFIVEVRTRDDVTRRRFVVIR